MKVLILKNKITKSLKSQIKDIIDYYSTIEPLEITEKKVSLKPEYDIQKYYTETGTIDMEVISEKWLKNKVPTGYDIVIFISKEWKCDFLGGLNYISSNNPKLIIVRYVTGSPFTFFQGNESITLDGDKLTWTIKHELSHALCNLKMLPDLTHKYYLLGEPKDCFKTMKTWKYFKLNEKTGSLGHTVADLDTKLVDMLDELRGICGFPFIITSGYRTPEENAKIKGSVAGSAHTKRLAVDILCTDSKKRIKIIGEAYLMGFVGIGADKQFVHLDIDTSEKQRVWLY